MFRFRQKFKAPKPKLNMFKTAYLYLIQVLEFGIAFSLEKEMPTRLMLSLRNVNIDEGYFVFIFVFISLNHHTSFDGLQDQTVFTHILSKVIFFFTFHFASLYFYSYSLVFVIVLLACLLFHVCYACVKRASWKIGYTI